MARRGGGSRPRTLSALRASNHQSAPPTKPAYRPVQTAASLPSPPTVPAARCDRLASLRLAARLRRARRHAADPRPTGGRIRGLRQLALRADGAGLPRAPPWTPAGSSGLLPWGPALHLLGALRPSPPWARLAASSVEATAPRRRRPQTPLALRGPCTRPTGPLSARPPSAGSAAARRLRRWSGAPPPDTPESLRP